VQYTVRPATGPRGRTTTREAERFRGVRWWCGCVCAAVALFGGSAAAQGVTVQAVRLDHPLVLDGLLDEDVYRNAQPTTDFVQQFPKNAEPATERSQLWVFFDAQYVYVGFRCFDSQPERMVANEMRRDNFNIWLNDNMIVVLDTFRDGRTAFFFQTNPLGAMRDGIVIDENTTNWDYNTVWDARSRRFEGGWTGEMAIPFKSLRYRPGTSQVWGIHAMRVLRGKNEWDLLAGVPPVFSNAGYMHLAYEATLVGIDAPGGAKNLEVKPYGISTVTTNRPTGVENDLKGDFGVDARYGLGSTLTADFTYNTDFAQVEIDEQQVNLTRFSLFFPEKRDFFLEGQGVFDFAGSGARNSVSANTADVTPIVFFSRRIGLNAGQPVPIRGGGRLMGRAGRYTMGALSLHTLDEPSAGAVATNFSVVRVRRDIFRKSSIGGLMTDRSPSASAAGSNRVYGADVSLLFRDNVKLNAYYARSATTALTGDEESYRTQFRYPDDRYGLEVDLLKVGSAFNPEVGFLPRRNFRRNYVEGRFSPRPKRLAGVRKLTWQGSYARFTNGSGIVDSRQSQGTFKIDLNNSDYFNVDVIGHYEFLVAPFQVATARTIPVGGYSFPEVVGSYQLGPQRPVSGTFTLSRGGFYGGDRTTVSYAGRLNFSAQFSIEPRTSIDWVSLPQGDFRVTLIGARPIFMLTPQMFTSALVQYNSSAHTLETNVRFRWEYQPGSDLFVVYTDGRDTALPGFPGLLNRGFAVKLTRVLRF
jgi:hypothetical protein